MSEGVIQSRHGKLEGMSTKLFGRDLWDGEKALASRLEGPGWDIRFKEINNVGRGKFLRATRVMVKML